MASDAAARLKKFREKLGLSSRAFASKIGWSHTRYIHYEVKYKKDFLPPDLIAAIQSSPIALEASTEELAKLPTTGDLSLRERDSSPFTHGRMRKPEEIKESSPPIHKVHKYVLPHEWAYEAFKIAEKVLAERGITDKEEVKSLGKEICTVAEREECEFIDENLARWLLARADYYFNREK